MWDILFPFKAFKLRLLVLLILIVIVFISFAYARSKKIISGYILDCKTENPIIGAEVTVRQRGWGFINGSLVWDKEYVTSTQSDNSGYFKISYEVDRSANIIASKSGYISAQQEARPGEKITIKMLQGNDSQEVTYNCRQASECLSSSIEGGVTVFRNICK